MKYRIVQYIERQYEEDNFKFIPTTGYKYVAQCRSNWWPFWSDICYEENTKEDAQKFIDAMIAERKLPKVIIHEVQSE